VTEADRSSAGRGPRASLGRGNPRGVRYWLLLLVACAPADAQRDPGWELRVPERIEVAAGATAPLSIAIAVDRGLTVSKDAAVIVDLAPDDGVAIKKRRLGRADAVDPDADAPHFAAPIRGDTVGDHTVAVHVTFWLCGTRSCRPIDARKSAQIVVTAPEPPDAGVDAGHR